MVLPRLQTPALALGLPLTSGEPQLKPWVRQRDIHVPALLFVVIRRKSCQASSDVPTPKKAKATSSVRRQLRAVVGEIGGIMSLKGGYLLHLRREEPITPGRGQPFSPVFPDF